MDYRMTIFISSKRFDNFFLTSNISIIIRNVDIRGKKLEGVICL